MGGDDLAEAVLRARLALAMTPARLCEHVAKGAARYYGVTVSNLRGPSRARKYAFARFMAMRLLRDAGLSFESIGDYFHRDHGTVIHACERMEELLKLAEFKRQLAE